GAVAPGRAIVGSEGVGGNDLAAATGREGLVDPEADLLLDEPDAAVGEEEVGAAGVARPVLVGMGQARGGVGAVPLAGVPEDQGPAPFRIEARLALERHQGDARIGDRTGPGGAGEVLTPFADGERLAGAIQDLGDGHRAVPEEESLTVVAPGGTVVIIDDGGIEAGRVPVAKRPDVVRRRYVAN